MPNFVMIAVEYSGYISIVKFVVFLAAFFLWLPIVNWVYKDAQAVQSRAVSWTGIIFGAAAATMIIWMVVPIFIAGLLLYAAALGATALTYVKHRNTKVLEQDRVLTIQHIKGLLGGKKKKFEELSSFLFITANNNEVPVPEPKTPDFFGYRAAHDILTDASWRRASNIIFTPAAQDYSVIYNVDGVALKQPNITPDQMEYLIRFLKHLGDLDVNEKRKPQKGKFRTNQNKVNTDWEITTAGSTAGEQVRIKQITRQSLMTLSDIGFSPDQYEQLNKLRQVKQGLFVVSGPSKSGVTTTLYSLLRNHDAFINSINTLERRPSAELPNITQNIFRLSDTGTATFARRLQTVIRMGPDIVGVSDCEDAETAQMACAGAKDGKLIYVSIKADSVLQALGKWIKYVGNKSQAAEMLIGICNQRLLRKLCNECKQAYAPNKELLRKYNIAADKVKAFYRDGKVKYDKRGRASTCENCQGTGFVGRTGVFEMIIINDELRQAIMQSKSLADLSKQFRLAKMLYLQEQALRKVISGTVAINEMLRALATAKKKQNVQGEREKESEIAGGD